MKQQHTSSELERYLAGDLDGERARSIEADAEHDEALGSWIRERKAEQRAFLLDPRRRPFSQLVAQAGVRPKHSFFKLLFPSFGLGAAALAAVLVAVVLIPRSDPVRFRQKGGLSVRTAVLEGEQATMLDDARKLHPGDRLRLTVEDPRGGFVTVLLSDASGRVDVLYSPSELGRLGPGSHLLPDSMELDQVLGWERLYVIMSDDAPDVAAWKTEIEQSHRRAGFDHGWLPAGQARVSTLEYLKESGQ